MKGYCLLRWFLVGILVDRYEVIRDTYDPCRSWFQAVVRFLSDCVTSVHEGVFQKQLSPERPSITYAESAGTASEYCTFGTLGSLGFLICLPPPEKKSDTVLETARFELRTINSHEEEQEYQSKQG